MNAKTDCATMYSTSVAVATLEFAASATSGHDYCIAAATTKEHPNATTKGTDSVAVARGIAGTATACGVYSVAVAHGWYAKAFVEKSGSIAVASGRQGEACGVKGSALFLVYRDVWGEIRYARALIVGQDGIKPNTLYSLDRNGELVARELPAACMESAK